MKGKVNCELMATMLLLMLLAGTFSVTMKFTPVSAETEVKYLTISYLPSEMPEPATVPSVGLHELAKGWTGPIEAPDIVETSNPGIRYKFVQWAIWWEETQEWHNFTDNPHTVVLDQNKTAYACYKVQYKLSVSTPYSTPYSQVEGEVWVAHPPDRWLDADTKVRAGVPVSEVTIRPNMKAVFEKWVINGVDDGTDRISDWFFMDGPKVAVAVWKIRYYLYVKAAPPEPRPDLGGCLTPPEGEGWYDECEEVELEADEFQAVHDDWRLRFDYWDVDGEPVEGNPIFVHMDTNHTATAHYWLQYKLWVKTDPADIVEIPGTGFYDTCTDVLLEAPEFVYISDVARYRFDKWVVTNVGTFTEREIEFHVPHYLPTLPFVATAYYKLQYYLEVKDNIDGLSCVSTQSGWFDKTTTVPLSAPSTVPVDEGAQYVFVKWVKDPGGYVDTNPDTTIKMTSPRVATAYYKLQWLVTWRSDPEGIIAGEKWFDNCTVDYPWAPPFWDDPTSPIDWVFDHWIVNGVPRPRGQNPIQVHYGEPTDLVAVYRQMNAFVIIPESTFVTVDPYVDPCTRTFKVNVTALNFEDLYGIDMKITWDANLIELVDVEVELREIWPVNFWWDDYGDGWYQLVGTSLDEGFYGSHKIVTLTFHIKYEPCYPDVCSTSIAFEHVILSNSKAEEIIPELLLGANYQISSVKPKLELRPSEVVANKFPFSFTVELWAVDVIKLNSYFVEISFDPSVFEVVKVVIHDDFLQGPTFRSHSYSIYPTSIVIWVEQADGMPLARGEGLLASITFKLKYGIIWNINEPEILSYIDFIYADIDVLCPNYRILYAPDYLDVKGVTFRYLPKPGDVNMDGVVGLEDLRIIAAHYGEGSYNPYDLNLNGKVDLFDLVLVAINYEEE
ncbi:MAG: hypothetical protein QXL57_02585 [Candidatus Bathyarchaeia archaeon]